MVLIRLLEYIQSLYAKIHFFQPDTIIRLHEYMVYAFISVTVSSPFLIFTSMHNRPELLALLSIAYNVVYPNLLRIFRIFNVISEHGPSASIWTNFNHHLHSSSFSCIKLSNPPHKNTPATQPTQPRVCRDRFMKPQPSHP